MALDHVIADPCRVTGRLFWSDARLGLDQPQVGHIYGLDVESVSLQVLDSLGAATAKLVLVREMVATAPDVAADANLTAWLDAALVGHPDLSLRVHAADGTLLW